MGRSYAPPERTLREKRLPSIHLQPQPKADPPQVEADKKASYPSLIAFPHAARPPRCRALPAAVEPGLRARPFLSIDRQCTVKRCSDVQIGDRKCRAGKPLRFRERSLQHVERCRYFLPCGLGDLLFALGLRKLRGMPDVVHDLAVEPVGLPYAPLRGQRLVSGVW